MLLCITIFTFFEVKNTLQFWKGLNETQWEASRICKDIFAVWVHKKTDCVLDHWTLFSTSHEISNHAVCNHQSSRWRRKTPHREAELTKEIIANSCFLTFFKMYRAGFYLQGSAHTANHFLLFIWFSRYLSRFEAVYESAEKSLHSFSKIKIPITQSTCW